MIRAILKIALILILLIATASVATPTYWRVLSPGIQYTKLNMLSGFHIGHLHAFRINLNDYQLELAIAGDEHDPIATVADLTLLNKGLIGVNGGFFSQELKPLGLRIANYEQKYPLKATTWWSIFYIKEGKPHIVSQKSFKNQKNIQFAVQCGPRLIVDGKIPITLKPGLDSRSALGITKDDQVILAVTENLKLSTTEFAHILHRLPIDGGLGCTNALNLDGGSSTQLYAKLKNFNLNLKGYNGVTDAIIVIPKKRA